MVYSIVKQSIEIRLRFEQVPKIYADSECAAAIGMLAKKYGLPLPQRRDDLKLMKQELADQTGKLPADEVITRLEEILYPYDPKAPVNDEIYDLLVYSYETT